MCGCVGGWVGGWVWFRMVLNCHVSNVFLLLMSLLSALPGFPRACEVPGSSVPDGYFCAAKSCFALHRQCIECSRGGKTWKYVLNDRWQVSPQCHSSSKCTGNLTGSLDLPKHVLYRRIQLRQSQTILHPVSVNLHQSNSFA